MGRSNKLLSSKARQCTLQLATKVHQQPIRSMSVLSTTATSSKDPFCTRTCLKFKKQGILYPAKGFMAQSFSTTTFEEKQSANKEEKSSDPVNLILEKSLLQVPQHGWTIEALAAGAKDCGFPTSTHGVCDRGAIDLVNYFMDQCHENLINSLSSQREHLQSLSVTDRVKFIIKSRLSMIHPYIGSWPQAMSLGALPANAPITMQKLAKLMDEIWYFVGDQSTDAMTWYTKRGVLSGIYVSTELFMLSDVSENYQVTWAFLDRRVKDAIALGEMKPQNMNEIVGMMTIGAQALFSAGTSLAGPLMGQFINQSAHAFTKQK